MTTPAIRAAKQDAVSLFSLFKHGRRLSDADARLAFGMALVDDCETSIEGHKLLQRLADHIEAKRAARSAEIVSAQKAGGAA